MFMFLRKQMNQVIFIYSFYYLNYRRLIAIIFKLFELLVFAQKEIYNVSEHKNKLCSGS